MRDGRFIRLYSVGSEDLAQNGNIAVEKAICYERRMGSKFGCLAQNIFVLQDHKRLPARFFARISGALGGRLTFA